MPKTRKPPPPAILDHLLQRFREGRIPSEDFTPRSPRGPTRSVLDLAAFEAADAFFEQAQTLVERRDGAKLDFDRLSPVMERPKNLGLHVAHLLDELVADLDDLAADLAGDLFADLGDLVADLLAELGNLAAHLLGELVA